MGKKDFYTTSELAKILGISRIAVFKRIKNSSIKAQKAGRNFVVFKKDIRDENLFLSDLLKSAKEWVMLGKEISSQFYCQNSGIFQARLIKMEELMIKNKNSKKIFSLLVSIAGEIGNNSYDHNLGNWPDIPGIFFGYDLKKRQIVLADKGIGILSSLKRVKQDLKNDQQALKTAFTEAISGRHPEARGNGLKYVRIVISKNPINLIFQTGNAKLKLMSEEKKLNMGRDIGHWLGIELNIEETDENIQGCLAFISW